MGGKARAEPADDTESDVSHVSDSDDDGRSASSGDKRKKPEAQKFKKCDTVKVHGLVKAAVHNDQQGVLGKYDNTTQRWEVTLENGTVISVKVANLTLVPAAPVLELNKRAKKLASELSGIVGSSAGNDASNNTALVVAGNAGRAVLTNAGAVGTAVQNISKRAAGAVVQASRTHGRQVATITFNGVFNGLNALGGMVCAGLANQASNSTYARPQIVNSTAAPAGAAAPAPAGAAAPAPAGAGAAAAVGGGFGFGRVPQAAPPDPPATPLDQTFAGVFQTAGNNPTVFVPAHKISSCIDGEPKMADPIIQNGGIPWDICQLIPNTDKWGLVVWVATNARTNGTIQGVWVQDAGKPKCPYGPNCAAHANGECQNSHAQCWAHGAPGFDGLPSNGCTCGKQGALAKVPGHAICHSINHHSNACTHRTPLGPCAGHKWTPGNDDSSGTLPQYCQAHLVDWTVEQIRNSILEEQDQTQLFPAPIDKEPWGPSNSAYMHLKTKCGDAGQKLVRTAITKAYGNKKTSREELKAWDAPLDDEDY
jgi:hypothetical protein